MSTAALPKLLFAVGLIASCCGLPNISAAETPAAATPAPPQNVTVIDRPDDVGTALVVRWELSADDSPKFKPPRVLTYQIARQDEGAGEFEIVGEKTYGDGEFVDDGCKRGVEYRYQVRAVAPDGTESDFSPPSDSAVPTMQWFDSKRGWFGILLLGVCGAVTYFIEVARSGKDLKIRKIAGLEAIDEAVGRATEMGRSCLFVPGILDINDIQTIAGLTVLSRVAELTAEYDAHLVVPTSRSLVMTAARETTEAAYLAAGRPDAYREDDIYYLTDEQFGYVDGVTGMMVRANPAACLYMWRAYAESLLLAEVGNSVGAIQVAGTAMPSQLPFFVAACDYTLIGEEFFAATAYLSNEPHQLGSLQGQDLGKLVVACLMVIGCSFAALAELTGNAQLASVFEYLRDHVMGTGGFLP